jgi:hypothetical protein
MADMCDHQQLKELLDFKHIGDPPVECPDCHQLVEVEYEETWDGEEEGNFFWLHVVRPKVGAC